MITLRQNPVELLGIFCLKRLAEHGGERGSRDLLAVLQRDGGHPRLDVVERHRLGVGKQSEHAGRHGDVFVAETRNLVLRFIGFVLGRLPCLWIAVAKGDFCNELVGFGIENILMLFNHPEERTVDHLH